MANTTKRALFVAGAMGLALAAANGVTTDAKAEDNEKCYGVAKAGHNDCQTNTSSCAGTSTTDAQGDAWIFVPAGTCDKLVGGSTEPLA